MLSVPTGKLVVLIPANDTVKIEETAEIKHSGSFHTTHGRNAYAGDTESLPSAQVMIQAGEKVRFDTRLCADQMKDRCFDKIIHSQGWHTAGCLSHVRVCDGTQCFVRDA